MKAPARALHVVLGCWAPNGTALRATRNGLGGHRCHPAGKTHHSIVYSRNIYAMRHMKFLGLSYTLERTALLGRRSSFVNTHYTANASLLGERYRLLQSRAVRYTDHLANLTANLSGPRATQCQRRGCGGYSPCSSDARSERRVPNRTCFASAGAGVVGLAWCQPNGRSGGAVECIADGELTPCYCSTGA